MGLAQENLVRGLSLGSLGHQLNVDLDTRAATTGSLAGGAGESGRTHVLDAGDGIRGKQLEAGLEEQLLTEGITHLDSRTISFGFLGELAGGKGGTSQTITAGLGTDIENGVPHTLGSTAGDLLVTEDAQAEGVHQRVATIGLVKIDLSGHGRKSDAVAVVGDAGDDTREEAAIGLGLFCVPLDGAETEGIHEEHGTRSHGEDVADDAADTGGRTLEGLDSAGVIVTLDLERHGPSVTDVNDAGILLTRLNQNAGASGGEFAKLRTGILV